MRDIVYVKGNIIFKSGNHQVKELVAYASEDWEKIAEVIIEKDLIVTNKDLLMPYKIYCASEEISTYGNFVSGMQRPSDAIRIYREEINNLKRLLNIEISDDLTDVFNRQIYIGIIGTMELFLCDFLYSMVLGTRKYYRRYCENCSSTFKLKEISNTDWKIQDAVIKTILETNYHKIDEIKKIYKKTLDTDFPSIEKLEKQILTRHSLVHRNGFPSAQSEYIKVNRDMINELIIEVEILVNHIINTKQFEINNWFPDPREI